MLSLFPRGVLDEILNLIESVSEGFPSYFWKIIFGFPNDIPDDILMMGKTLEVYLQNLEKAFPGCLRLGLSWFNLGFFCSRISVLLFL